MDNQAAVIIGATSALGQSVARLLVARAQPLILVARNADKLAVVRQDLEVRGGSVIEWVADLDDLTAHTELVANWQDASDFYFFYGTLPDQEAAEADWRLAEQALHTNFLSAASLLTHIANLAEKRGTGRIVVVTSVAGDRARKSNYVYGTAKGALSLYSQGLRNRLSASGVQLTTVKPGFIDTPMTAAVPKRPAVLWATPERVAKDIVNARDAGRDVIYTPWFWRYILLIIRAIPERVFKNLSL